MIKEVSRAVDSLREFLIGMPRVAKSVVAFMTDLVGFGPCVLAALWLVALGPSAFSPTRVVVVAALVSVGVARWQRMYRSVVRYLGLDFVVAGSLSAVR